MCSYYIELTVPLDLLMMSSVYSNKIISHDVKIHKEIDYVS